MKRNQVMKKTPNRPTANHAVKRTVRVATQLSVELLESRITLDSYMHYKGTGLWNDPRSWETHAQEFGRPNVNAGRVPQLDDDVYIDSRGPLLVGREREVATIAYRPILDSLGRDTNQPTLFTIHSLWVTGSGFLRINAGVRLTITTSAYICSAAEILGQVNARTMTITQGAGESAKVIGSGRVNLESNLLCKPSAYWK